MIDWKSKLTSRKFWMAVVGFVTGVLLARGMTEAEAAQIGGLIMSGASVVAYIIGEGLADAAHVNDMPDCITIANWPEEDVELDDGK